MLMKPKHLFWKAQYLSKKQVYNLIDDFRLFHQVHQYKYNLFPSRYAEFSPFIPVYVDPLDIQFVQTLPISHPLSDEKGRFPRYYFGRSVGGDWDLKRRKITTMPLYKGLKERFVDGLQWKETVLHPDKYSVDHQNLSIRYNQYSNKEFEQRGQYLDKLYTSIQKSGYQPSAKNRIYDTVSITIGRDGTLIRNLEGIHRLIISQLIGIDLIPVKIQVIHSEINGDVSSLEEIKDIHG